MENDNTRPQEIIASEQNTEPTDMTRSELLACIDELIIDIRQQKDTATSIIKKRFILAELLDSLGLDYTTPAYYPELRKIQTLQKQVDRLADIVADKIGDKADKADIHAITDMRNMNLEEALYTATIILVRNGESAKDLDKLIHNT